jgi:hypothetical protein
LEYWLFVLSCESQSSLAPCSESTALFWVPYPNPAIPFSPGFPLFPPIHAILGYRRTTSKHARIFFCQAQYHISIPMCDLMTHQTLLQEEMEASEDETERDRRLAVEAQDREFARVLQVSRTQMRREVIFPLLFLLYSSPRPLSTVLLRHF